MNSEKSLPEEWRRLVEEAMESAITKEEFKAFLIEVGQQKGITIA
ncbi:DNA-binding anti-repressor SinI [Alkalihalobacillus macyae]|nr:DNA-binding anti-repressor SinI [Alkalihalobacillus macyae]MDP4550613.1 DNA-binding anti-repressor SinI [Alkalihalobacillus macyae]